MYYIMWCNYWVNQVVFSSFLCLDPIRRLELHAGLLLHPGDLFLNVKMAPNVVKHHHIYADNYTKLCTNHAQLSNGNIWDEKQQLKD